MVKNVIFLEEKNVIFLEDSEFSNIFGGKKCREKIRVLLILIFVDFNVCNIFVLLKIIVSFGEKRGKNHHHHHHHQAVGVVVVIVFFGFFSAGLPAGRPSPPPSTIKILVIVVFVFFSAGLPAGRPAPPELVNYHIL